MATKEVAVSSAKVLNFIERCMVAVGTSREHARILGNVLLSADERGHHSHGLNRLDMYVSEIKTGVTVSGDKQPTILKETVATALVDGNSLLGPVVGTFCMNLAISKAREAGIGWISVRGSNHFGIAQWYGLMAQEQGLIGMAFTNTSPGLVPTRAKVNTLGTSPICVVAPAKGEDSFILDMATTSVARGKIEMKKVVQQDMPSGWAVDIDGKETKDPTKAAGLLPLGGTEQSGGYKGYGLSMMVEIFCSILSGATWGPHVRKFKEYKDPANLGQCFVAIDPAVFEDGFSERLQQLLSHCRGLEPIAGEEKVLVPGDKERDNIEKVRNNGGISYHPNQISSLNDLANQLGVDALVSNE